MIRKSRIYDLVTDGISMLFELIELENTKIESFLFSLSSFLSIRINIRFLRVLKTFRLIYLYFLDRYFKICKSNSDIEKRFKLIVETLARKKEEKSGEPHETNAPTTADQPPFGSGFVSQTGVPLSKPFPFPLPDLNPVSAA